MIFSKSYCPYCKRAKGLLTEEVGADGFKVFEWVSSPLLEPCIRLTHTLHSV